MRRMEMESIIRKKKITKMNLLKMMSNLRMISGTKVLIQMTKTLMMNLMSCQ